MYHQDKMIFNNNQLINNLFHLIKQGSYDKHNLLKYYKNLLLVLSAKQINHQIKTLLHPIKKRTQIINQNSQTSAMQAHGPEPALKNHLYKLHKTSQNSQTKHLNKILLSKEAQQKNLSTLLCRCFRAQALTEIVVWISQIS